MTYNYDHVGIRERVLASIEGDDDLLQKAEKSQERIVTRAEFMLLTQDSLHSLNMMALHHNYTVAQLEARISRAARLEEIDGVRVYYYLDEETMDIQIEAEVKEYGLIPHYLEAGLEVSVQDTLEVESEPEEVIHAEATTVEYDLDGYQEIDKTDFFLITEQIRNRLSMVAMQLNEQIGGLKTMVEEIEDYEGAEGVNLIFLYDDETDQFSYLVKKKRAMGFAMPQATDE